MGMKFSISSSGYSFIDDFFNSDGSYESDHEKDYNYYIIDNRMKEDITNNIKTFVKNVFEGNNSTKDRAENIKKRLDEVYSNIFWNVFIYQNGYCKVSFSDELYICGKVLSDYIIIYGMYKSYNTSRRRNRSRSKSVNERKNKSRINNQSRSKSRSRSNSRRRSRSRNKAKK